MMKMNRRNKTLCICQCLNVEPAKRARVNNTVRWQFHAPILSLHHSHQYLHSRFVVYIKLNRNNSIFRWLHIFKSFFFFYFDSLPCIAYFACFFSYLSQTLFESLEYFFFSYIRDLFPEFFFVGGRAYIHLIKICVYQQGCCAGTKGFFFLRARTCMSACVVSAIMIKDYCLITHVTRCNTCNNPSEIQTGPQEWQIQ